MFGRYSIRLLPSHATAASVVHDNNACCKQLGVLVSAMVFIYNDKQVFYFVICCSNLKIRFSQLILFNLNLFIECSMKHFKRQLQNVSQKQP